MDDDDYLNAMAEFDSELADAMGVDDMPSSDDEGPATKVGAKKGEKEDGEDHETEDSDSDDEELPENMPYGFKLPAEELRYRHKLKEWAERDAMNKRRHRNNHPFRSEDLLPRVYFDISCGELKLGRIVFVLFPGIAPKACENFRALSTGEKGIGRSGHPLSYKGCYFHRIVSAFCAQSGDITHGDGSGGESIYGHPFEDELQTLHHHHHHHKDESEKIDAETTANSIFPFHRMKKQEVLHHVKLKRGRLITASAGPNCNRSQFCILFNRAEWLYNKCSVFGTIESGEDVLMAMELAGTKDGRPAELFHISDCGQLVLKNVAVRKKLTSRHLHYDLIWIES